MYVSMCMYMLIMYNMEGVSFLIIGEHIDNANVCVCVWAFHLIVYMKQRINIWKTLNFDTHTHIYIYTHIIYIYTYIYIHISVIVFALASDRKNVRVQWCIFEQPVCVSRRGPSLWILGLWPLEVHWKLLALYFWILFAHVCTHLHANAPAEMY